MNADDLKRMEKEGHLAPGYSLMAFDPNTGQYEEVTGVFISADHLRLEVRTDKNWECMTGPPDE